MKTVAGLWIDHRKAFLVMISESGETTREILSNTEKQLGRVAGVKLNTPFEPLRVKADDAQERGFDGRMDVFYKEVSALLKDAGSILIFGPGEAKDELKKYMEKNGKGGSITAVEAADKLTDNQIAAKVRGFFMRAN